MVAAIVTAALWVGTASTFAKDPCAPTARDYLGPFYVAGTPVLEDLNRFGKPGEALIVSGMVLSAAEGHPAVAGARIEVWQTDSDGRYHPEGKGKAGDYADADIDLRGTVLADVNGSYRFRTVVPGRYAPRARHIHYRLTAAGFETLITQHYLSDGEDVPGGACRSGAIIRSDGGASFGAPAFYLQPDG